MRGVIIIASLMALSTSAAAAPTMLFLHGMQSKYDRPAATIEQAAQRYAEATGYNLEVIPPTGDDRKWQEELAKDRIAHGDVAAIYGFSMGGYTAERLRRIYSNIKYIVVGAPGVEGDIEPVADHMDKPSAMVSGGPIFDIKIDDGVRKYRNTCTITMRDPVSSVIMGVYHCVTGGYSRGSAPLGSYEIGKFRNDGRIGPRWNLRQLGHDEGEVWDPKLKDMRTGIELHGGHKMDGTQGCIGINEPSDVYDRFMHQLRYIIGMVGTVTFDLLGKEDKYAKS